MDGILIVVLSLLIWITSKLTFCFYEVLAVDSSIERDAPNLKRTFIQSLKYSYKFNKSEILATVFHMTVNTFLFMAILTGSMCQLSFEACEYISNHVLFFIFFDYAINVALLIVVNYVITYKIKYVMEMKPMPQISLDPKLFGLQ